MLKRKKRLRRRASARWPTKYRATSCKYGGRTFHSRKEAEYAASLDMLKKARGKDRVTEWRGQVRVPLYGKNGTRICDYYCDFLVTFADGREEWHEVKGYETPVWAIKHKLFLDNYPERTFRLIK